MSSDGGGPLPSRNSEGISRGTLYVVATPVGNLGDITLRALDILKSVDAVVCEDTRHTRKLLARHGIHARLESHFSGNEERKIPLLAESLLAGKNLALVSDAGTPAVSDPGYLLVRACRKAGIPVVPIPGPSAMTAALSVSGLPLASVRFLGFPPRKASARASLLEALAGDSSALVFYEAPRRVRSFLAQARDALQGRELFVAREMTKVFETFYTDPEPEMLPEKGEYVIVFGPPKTPEGSIEMKPEDIAKEVEALVLSGTSPQEALRRAARKAGISRREAYNVVKGKGASRG
ncbi:MAG: 16S rRNA (cytidine(1402)-2'-O)-methyltransferase [Acidobacteria bacterium]|nr:16S rRNA (cytidine(1402)-2'-O)-methyltransferase [Acidobacteriota bacterium]